MPAFPLARGSGRLAGVLTNPARSPRRGRAPAVLRDSSTYLLTVVNLYLLTVVNVLQFMRGQPLAHSLQSRSTRGGSMLLKPRGAEVLSRNRARGGPSSYHAPSTCRPPLSLWAHNLLSLRVPPGTAGSW